MKYNREDLIVIFGNIPEPEIYEIGNEIINKKTILIKKIEKKYNLSWNECYKLYKLNYTQLEAVTEELLKEEV